MVGMNLARLEIKQLERAKSRLGEAVLDPGQWPSVMEAICSATATAGAALLQSDIRTPDIPVTPSTATFFRSYFDNNLHVGDIRAAKGVPLLLAGRRAVRDQDLFSSESIMLKDPLYAHASDFGFRWWSAIPVRMPRGDRLRGVSFKPDHIPNADAAESLRDRPLVQV